MLQERVSGIAEELAEVSSVAELEALWCFGQRENNEYGDAACVPGFKAAVARLRLAPPVQGVEEMKMEPEEADVDEMAMDLMRQIQELRLKLGERAPAPARTGKRYKLLSADVSWSSKPQVHALMAVLGAHAAVGDVLDESAIVAAMEANVGVLATRQGGKRIWDYYKGASGLMEHGNIEEVR